MSSLFDNDLVVCVNKRVLRNLAISMDHAVEMGVSWAVVQLEGAKLGCAQLGTWLARGLEHPSELIANAVLPVPRVLYATTNPGFFPAVGATDLDSLVNHLKEFDDVASGPVAATLENGDAVCGVPLDLPCPITFKRDVGRRITFLRAGFFENNAPDFVEVTPQGVTITLQGTAYQGDFFSRDLAQKSPTHQFSMRLLFDAQFVESDLGFGPVPFQMVTTPPSPSQAGLPSLPREDSFVFAGRFGTEDGNFVLPAPVPFDGVDDDEGCDNPNGCQPENVLGDMYYGQLGDLLFESTEVQQTPEGEFPVPRYRVETFSESEPERLVIRRIDDPLATVLAEARGGRLALRFVKIDDLDLTPINGGSISQADEEVIGRSLTKFNPTLSQSFVCALEQPPGEGQDAARDSLRQLQLLGRRGMDLPLLPQHVFVPVEANVVRAIDDDDIQNGHPLHAVKSKIVYCPLTARKYFADPDPAKQAFAVSGKVGGAGDEVFLDFSDGSDLALGTSQVFLQPMLDQMGSDAMEQIKSQGLPGLHSNTLDFKASLAEGKMKITVTGEGEIITPSPLPNVDYEFEAEIAVGMRTQKAVMVKEGSPPAPVDRFGCSVPDDALKSLKLSLLHNRLELPNALAPGATAGENPLSFQVYWDPGDGIACFDRRIDADLDGVPELLVEACPQPVRVAPPVLDADGNEVSIPDPENPPSICEGVEGESQGGDDAGAFGQAAFDLPENNGLKYLYGLMVLPPGEDDVEVTVDVDDGMMFLLSMLGIFLAPAIVGTLGLAGPVGLTVTPIVALGLMTGLLLLPFAGPLASVAVTIMARDQLKNQYRQVDLAGFDSGQLIGLFLREPTEGHESFVLQGPGILPGGKGAFIVRNHVVVQSAGINVGI